jgi:4-amino-4-deoxy-L-arabinose transferase-like glycosyltransferase
VAIVLDQGRHFVDVFLVGHNVQRFTSTIHRHPGSIFYYLPALAGGLFPWSGLLLPAFALASPRRSRVDLFLLLWLLLPLVFFSAAGSKLPGYILPCLAPLAILIGRAADAIVRGERDALPAWAGPRAIAIVGLVVGAALAAGLPSLLHFKLRDPGWTSLLPLSAWTVVTMLGASHALARAPAQALHLLRVGGAGVLVLFTLAAPEILLRHESGRALFPPARGRAVLAWGAWRTSWMAGYFYNDGKVREIQDIGEVERALAAGPALVLCGPGERRRLESIGTYDTHPLATGPRANALLRVARRAETE